MVESQLGYFDDTPMEDEDGVMMLLSPRLLDETTWFINDNWQYEGEVLSDIDPREVLEQAERNESFVDLEFIFPGPVPITEHLKGIIAVSPVPFTTPVPVYLLDDVEGLIDQDMI